MDLKNLGFNLYRDVPIYRTKGADPETVVFVGVTQRHEDELVLGVRVGFYGHHKFRLSYSTSLRFGLVAALCEVDEDGRDYGAVFAHLYGDRLTRQQMLRQAATIVVSLVALREDAEVVREREP